MLALAGNLTLCQNGQVIENIIRNANYISLTARGGLSCLPWQAILPLPIKIVVTILMERLIGRYVVMYSFSQSKNVIQRSAITRACITHA